VALKGPNFISNHLPHEIKLQLITTDS